MFRSKILSLNFSQDYDIFPPKVLVFQILEVNDKIAFFFGGGEFGPADQNAGLVMIDKSTNAITHVLKILGSIGGENAY